MVVPVFPLPNVVFFPQTVLPLNIFEPRYRQMVRDAAESEGEIAITLLKGNWKADYEGTPEIHSVGTLGKVDDLISLPDGRFNLKLVGLRRVRLFELPTSKLYRIARAESMDEPDFDETDELQRAKLDLLASHAYLLREISDEAGGSLAMDAAVPLRDAIHRVCANLPVEPEGRQQLLEMDALPERLAAAHQLVTELLERVLILKSAPGDGATDSIN